MIAVQQLHDVHRQLRQPYRPLCDGARVAYSSFMRWKARHTRGEPLIARPGPKPVAPLNLAALRRQVAALGHGRTRTAGTTALHAAHQDAISRRDFSTFVAVARRQIWRERAKHICRVHWRLPGAVWSVDPTQIQVAGQKLQVLPVQDLSARYRFTPVTAASLDGATVAAHLEKLFTQHGAPLVLKRDNGRNLNCAAVDEVLARHWVIPLNSPPHYPPYNGGIERAQRDLKAALRAHWPAAVLAVHELNHRPRRVLRGRTACEMVTGAKQPLRRYTRRMRKEAFDSIQTYASTLINKTPAAAWRRAVERWLQHEGIIAFDNQETVTQFP